MFLGLSLEKRGQGRFKMRRANPAITITGDSEMQVQFTVNGRAASVDVPPNTLLVHALREHLALTGTHVGCDTSQCGACTVHVNGRAVKSCAMLAVQAQGAEVTTIEGMAAPDGTMHPMQAAFKECPRPAVRLLYSRHGDERGRPV